jgi:hypothetical protein
MEEGNAMQAADFKGTLSPTGQITVPAEIAAQVPSGEPVEVVLVWGRSEDDDWRQTGLRQFESAYAAEDAIYESLAHDPSAR